MKIIFALLLAFMATGAAPATLPGPVPSEEASPPGPFFLTLDLIQQIVCGTWTGTGSRIDSDLVLTAAHVASHDDCTIGGQPARVEYINGGLDIAVMRIASPAPTARMVISCAKPKPGGTYFAVGYAFGRVFAVQRYVGTGGKAPGSGQAIFQGLAFGGMSGGPMVDENGQIIGVVTQRNSSGTALTSARLLKDTYLCGGKA